MAQFELTYDYPTTPPPRLFDTLAGIDWIADVNPLPTRVTHVRDGEGHRYGVGSLRRIRTGPFPAFEEEIRVFEPPRFIEYEIRAFPFDEHVGSYLVEPAGAGSRFTFALRLHTPVPLVGEGLAVALQTMSRRGFDELRRRMEGGV